MLTALREYARADPAALPAAVLLSHTPTSLTLRDAFPKSNAFHLLVLPRIVPPLAAADLASLRALLAADRARARAVLDGLARAAAAARATVEHEMATRFGFAWPVFTGFHAVPSMEHLHLHVIASDLFAPALKTKKHYNSFHPTRGFFLHLDDVLAWFDAAPAHYAAMARLPRARYEPLLKEALVCWRCDAPFATMPQLKAHLRAEWEADLAKAKARKRKRQPKDGQDGADGALPKKQAVGGESGEKSTASDGGEKQAVGGEKPAASAGKPAASEDIVSSTA